MPLPAHWIMKPTSTQINRRCLLPLVAKKVDQPVDLATSFSSSRARQEAGHGPVCANMLSLFCLILSLALSLSLSPSCPGMHVGDESHCVFECPAFADIRRGFQSIFDDSHGAMRLFMWHPCQKDVASCLLQLLDRIDETLT